MYHAGSAHERTDEADHEIDGGIRGQDAQIAHSGPKWVPRGERPTLLQIVFVRQDGPCGAATGTRGVDDAGDIVFLAHHEIRRALPLEVLPAKCTRKIGA